MLLLLHSIVHPDKQHLLQYRPVCVLAAAAAVIRSSQSHLRASSFIHSSVLKAKFHDSRHPICLFVRAGNRSLPLCHNSKKLRQQHLLAPFNMSLLVLLGFGGSGSRSSSSSSDSSSSSNQRLLASTADVGRRRSMPTGHH